MSRKHKKREKKVLEKRLAEAEDLLHQVLAGYGSGMYTLRDDIERFFDLPVPPSVNPRIPRLSSSILNNDFDYDPWGGIDDDSDYDPWDELFDDDYVEQEGG
ncbi:hypothetical protein KAR91_73205 [Candidatus Pacearchaeota archaeon]|nr:hypothetical protein [Candidatus Pacearchaeota archaeon]